MLFGVSHIYQNLRTSQVIVEAIASPVKTTMDLSNLIHEWLGNTNKAKDLGRGVRLRVARSRKWEIGITA